MCTERPARVADGEFELSVPNAATSLSPGNSPPRPPDFRRDVVFLPFCVREAGPLRVGKGSTSDEAILQSEARARPSGAEETLWCKEQLRGDLSHQIGIQSLSWRARELADWSARKMRWEIGCSAPGTDTVVNPILLLESAGCDAGVRFYKSLIFSQRVSCCEISLARIRSRMHVACRVLV